MTKKDSSNPTSKEQKRWKWSLIAIIVIIILLLLLLLLLKNCGWKQINLPDNWWTTKVTSKSFIKQPKYSIKDFYAEIITDLWEEAWWKYYYVETAEDWAEVKYWITTEEENAITAKYTIKNLSFEDIDFLPLLSAKVVVNDEKEYQWTTFVTNIWQLDAKWYEVRSLESIPLKPWEESYIWMVVDVPRELARSDDKLELQFTIDGDVYYVDLRDEMEIIDE